MGDPAGVGPEVVAKAIATEEVRSIADVVVFGDASCLATWGDITMVSTPSEARGVGAIAVIDVSGLTDVVAGSPDARTDRAQVDYIVRAVEAVRGAAADALVTAPISKAAIRRAGVKWPGHTEMLADLCGGMTPVMMLAGPTLRTVPVTTHVSLRDVPDRLDAATIAHAIRTTGDALSKFFAIKRPRIAVAGLNPHAGEGGLFGSEEADVITPAIESAFSEHYDVSGPHSPDVVFRRAAQGEYDAVIGMYHDQALIPVKLMDFDRSVNVTLGLPMIRTSVDHGTAYDIAGRSVASESSMVAALRLAAEMVRASTAHGCDPR